LSRSTGGYVQVLARSMYKIAKWLKSLWDNGAIILIRCRLIIQHNSCHFASKIRSVSISQCCTVVKPRPSTVPVSLMLYCMWTSADTTSFCCTVCELVLTPPLCVILYVN
jgi:hypothetical protein